uniref:E3 ubiquitin-protein ligase TRIM9 n=1 Tax=Glossina pallidipes TaxID=7398 RepID=A0A1A9ZPX3_GLOPL
MTSHAAVKDGDERLPAGEMLMLDDNITNNTFTTSILSTNTVINTFDLSMNSSDMKTSTLRSNKSNKSTTSSLLSQKMNAFKRLINYDETLSYLLSNITNENFAYMTAKAPLPPAIIPEDCSAENNSVTVAWQAPSHSFVEGYVLELDDGSGGEFRQEVYCGKETICTVDGLHFNSMYNARVKAFNSAGEGEYSELIGLQTAEVAWFTFDPVLSGGPGSGLIFSKNNATVSVEGWEHRVALGSVGFSRGIHYWEFTIDNYTADTDPAFGVARIDVNRSKMLGKDEKSFAMYIDRQRSWFQHNSVHERRVEGGISTGSTIGVLLDLQRHTLSFLVNGMPQGSVAFRDLYGVFYPAVSINRGVTLTLHTALDAPQMDYF